MITTVTVCKYLDLIDSTADYAILIRMYYHTFRGPCSLDGSVRSVVHMIAF